MALTACGLRVSSLGGPTPTAFIITSTLPPTAIPSPTLTPIPDTPTATTAPISGMTATQINVRSQPSATADQLGVLAPFVKIQIIGKDSGGDWFEIAYPQAPGGMAWVIAQYINVQNKDTIPVIGVPAVSPTAEAGTETPSASGTVIQQINVRKGPGTEFDSVGMLNAKESAALTGRDASGSWLQIAYAAAPDGKGWVAAAFIQSAATDSLPVVGKAAAAVPPGTPTAIAASPSPTPAVAPPDNDSAEAPAVSAILSPSGTRALIYSSEVSAPQGDTEDFVAFTASGSSVLASLACQGSGDLQMMLEGQAEAAPGSEGPSCGRSESFSVHAGQTYLLRLSILPSSGSASYVNYTLRIEYAG